MIEPRTSGLNASAARPVRVCFVIENLLSAGTELWVQRLIERLDRRRVHPSLCLTDGTQSDADSLTRSDCPTLRLGLRHLRDWRTFAAVRNLRKFLAEQAVDVVQVHHADPTYLAVPVARWASVPVVVQTKYDTGYWLQGWDLRFHRWLRPWVDLTIANCEACRVAAITQEGAPPETVQVIDNGIDTSRFAELPALCVEDFRGPVRVGMIANLRPVKDPHNLVQAASLLAGEFPQISFHLAGQGELAGALCRQIESLGLQSRVKLHGPVADPAAFLQQMQIAVLCSRSEGLPHALLESMAAGRTVVATSVGGNRELIEDGVNGLLVPAGDSAALAAAVRACLREPRQAVQRAAVARGHVVARFGLDAMARRFEHFYETIMAVPRRSTYRALGRFGGRGGAADRSPAGRNPAEESVC